MSFAKLPSNSTDGYRICHAHGILQRFCLSIKRILLQLPGGDVQVDAGLAAGTKQTSVTRSSCMVWSALLIAMGLYSPCMLSQVLSSRHSPACSCAHLAAVHSYHGSEPFACREPRACSCRPRVPGASRPDHVQIWLQVTAQSLSPVVSPKHAPADPMFLVHPALKEPLAEHLLPLLSLEDLANLRASCRAMKDLVDSGPAGFGNNSQHLDPYASYPQVPTLRSPFEAAGPK